jgi:mannose-6-phosphate isomerase-like protein (cupin superfamily)
MIKVRKLSEEPGESEKEDGSLAVNSVDVILKRTDLKGFSSRILRIQPGGHTAFHEHSREHVVIVLNGRCRVETKAETLELREAMLVSVPGGVTHRFFNPGNERLALLILNLFTEDETKSVSTEPPPIKSTLES